MRAQGFDVAAGRWLAAVAEREAAVTVREAACCGVEAQLNARSNDLSARSADISGRERRLADWDARLRDWDARLQQLQTQIKVWLHGRTHLLAVLADTSACLERPAFHSSPIAVHFQHKQGLLQIANKKMC